MKFLEQPQSEAIQTIADRICAELSQNKRVLWLTSGGSNTQAQVEIMKLVREQVEDKLPSLAILPMDERYGPMGHDDSNTEALRRAGFDPGEASWVDVLTHDVPMDQTVGFYGDVASAAIQNAAVIIGQFGLGADAHTAGILPDSPAAEADEVVVAGYEWTDYTRMTLTPAALSRVHVAYVLAYGDNKMDALKRLQQNTEPLAKLPAKLLYDIPEVYVYTDQPVEDADKE